MLKVRIIPTLLYKDFGLVKGVRFDSRRGVGSAMQAIKVYNLRGVDELVFLDVAATLSSRGPDFALVDNLADDCFMPLTVGGGVRSIDDVARLLQMGADKVATNSAAVVDPKIITEAANRFGTQCMVASIDFRMGSEDLREVWTHSGTRPTGLGPVAVAKSLEDAGAGEILLTSIDRDGTMEGYDLEVLAAVASAVSVPVIASGGAGTFFHMAEALRAGASAVAAASMFHFTQQTPMEAKTYLAGVGFHVRSG